MPVRLREHERRRGSGAVVPLVEQPAGDGTDPHYAEVVAGDDARLHSLRFFLAVQRRINLGELGEPLERGRSVTVVDDLGHRKPDVVQPDRFSRLPEEDQAVAIAVGQGAQQCATDHAEDGRVRADAERERQNDGNGETGDPRQTPDGEAEVA
jgi:hypothetical protein